MPTIEQRLQVLEDERSILNTMYTYGHALDYGYEEEFVDCWTDDASLDWPTRPAPFHGKEAIRGAFTSHTHAPKAAHKHLLCEPRIRIEGDTARVDSMFVRVDQYSGIPHIRIYGRYFDEFRRCADGRWRFTNRKCESEARRHDAIDVLGESK